MHDGRSRDRGRASGLKLQYPLRRGKDTSPHSVASSHSPTASRGRSSLQGPAHRLPRPDEHRHRGHRLLLRDEHPHQGRRHLPRDEHPRPAHQPPGPRERLDSPRSPERQRLRPEPPPGREHRRQHLAPHRLQARPLPRRGEHPHPLPPHPHRGSRQPPAHRLQLPRRRAADGLRQWHRR